MGRDTEKKERLAAFEQRLQDEAAEKARAEEEKLRKRREARDEKRRKLLEAAARRRKQAEAARRSREQDELEALAQASAVEKAKLAADQAKRVASDEFEKFRAERLKQGGVAKKKPKTFDSRPVFFGGRKDGLETAVSEEDKAKLARLRTFEKKMKADEAKRLEAKRRQEVLRQKRSQERLLHQAEAERQAALHAAAEAALQAQVEHDQLSVGEDFAKFRNERLQKAPGAKRGPQRGPKPAAGPRRRPKPQAKKAPKPESNPALEPHMLPPRTEAKTPEPEPNTPKGKKPPPKGRRPAPKGKKPPPTAPKGKKPPPKPPSKNRHTTSRRIPMPKRRGGGR